MSDKVGPMTIGDKDENVFLGKELGRPNNHSEALTKLVDSEIKDIIEVQFQRCLKILSGNEPLLHTLANELLERETLTGDEIDVIYQKYINGNLKKEEKKQKSKNKRSRVIKDNGNDKA